jgi:hypothetical protein
MQATVEAIFQASSTKFCLFKFEEKNPAYSIYLTKKKCLNHKNNNNKKTYVTTNLTPKSQIIEL